MFGLILALVTSWVAVLARGVTPLPAFSDGGIEDAGFIVARKALSNSVAINESPRQASTGTIAKTPQAVKVK